MTERPVKGLPEGPIGLVPKLDPIRPTQKEYDCFVLINEARANPAAYGYGGYSPAPPLHWNAALLYIAWVHSKDMYEENYFEHDSYNRVGDQIVFDKTWSERVKSVYPYNTRISENIAWNSSGSASEIVATWMNSPPHRENIMNPEHTEGAIGAFGGSDKVYFTHDFGGRSISYNLAAHSSEIQISPPQPAPGETVRVGFLVHNTGTTDAFPVEIQISKRENGGGWAPVTGILWLQYILVGGQSASTYLDLDTTGYLPGTEIGIALDPNNLFTETSEADNFSVAEIIAGGSEVPGDLNEDGRLDGTDLFRFAVDWKTDDATCNLNAEGTVDCRDLIILLKMMDAKKPE